MFGDSSIKKLNARQTSAMIKHKRQLFYLLILVASLFSLSGCIFTVDGSRLPDQVLNSSDDLPADLATIQLLFSNNIDNLSSGLITTLDRQNQIDFTLANDGRKINVSRDNAHVVYSLVEIINHEFRSSIWLLELDTGLERRVILLPDKMSDISLDDPDFFPDGEKLILSIKWHHTNTIGLGSINLDGNNLEIINTPSQTFSQGPIVSPDGEKILVLCEGIDLDSGKPGFMLCIMDKDGSHRRQLMEDGNYHGTYLFTPDSHSIIYSEEEWGGLIGLINRPRYQINSIDIDGKNQNTILDWHRAINVLALSEDGNEIVFMDRPENGKPPRIYIIDNDGNNLRYLAYFDGFLADWYPIE